MSDTIYAKGQCLCGAVEIEAKSLQKNKCLPLWHVQKLGRGPIFGDTV